jgi:Domain of unknown function (DUF4376)
MMQAAVIDANGNVVNIIMANPATDQVPGCTLVAVGGSGADLGWTWTQGGGFVAPVASQAALMAYAYAKQQTISQGGVTVSGVSVATDAAGRADLDGAVLLAQLNPEQTFTWVTSAGSVSLSAAQIVAVGQAVGLWVQSTYTTLGTVIADIIGASVTTTAQIDGAAWPANS